MRLFIYLFIYQLVERYTIGDKEFYTYNYVYDTN